MFDAPINMLYCHTPSQTTTVKERMRQPNTELGSCLSLLLYEHSWTQVRLMELSKIDQSTLSRIVSGRRRDVDNATLETLCHCWPSREDNLRVLMAYLRDVIGRAGYDVHHTIEMRMRGEHASTVADHAEYVHAAALAHTAIGRLIVELASVIRSMLEHPANHAADPDRLAAEPPGAPYQGDGDGPDQPPPAPTTKPPRKPRKPRA
jgi:transcriptional regulator with XRE-family HTH domain